MIELSAPFLCEIAVTSECNMACLYCYARGRNQAAQMDVRLCKDLIAEMLGRGVFVVVVAGGEPFVHPDILDIVDYGSIRFGDRISLLTNGRALADHGLFEEFRRIVECNHKASGKKISLQVSLDSVSREINDATRGHTEEVLSVIRRLAALPLNLAIGTVVTKLNIDEPAGIITTFYPQVKTFHHMGLMTTARNRDVARLAATHDQMSALKAELRSLQATLPGLRLTGLTKGRGSSTIDYPGCLAGVTRLYIDPGGNVRACCMADEVVGNIHTQGFENIWFSPVLESIRMSTTPLCRAD